MTPDPDDLDAALSSAGVRTEEETLVTATNDTATLASMLDNIKTNWSASMSGEYSNGGEHADDYDVLTLAIKALKDK